VPSEAIVFSILMLMSCGQKMEKTATTYDVKINYAAIDVWRDYRYEVIDLEKNKGYSLNLQNSKFNSKKIDTFIENHKACLQTLLIGSIIGSKTIINGTPSNTINVTNIINTRPLNSNDRRLLFEQRPYLLKNDPYICFYE
jgi:hypothetical protein